MKKKIIFLGMAVLLSVGVLAGCGNNDKKDASKDSSAPTEVSSSKTEDTKAATELTEENYINVDKEKKEVHILATVNGTYFTEKTIHGISYKDGSNGQKAILASFAKPDEVYNALESFGLKPGDNLTTKSEKGAVIEGDKVAASIIIDGKEVPIEKTVLVDDKEPASIDFRFGGNLEANTKADTGCILCYNSCPLGIVSPTDYPFQTGANTVGNADVLPEDGTNVEVIIRPAS